jgi:urease accessory protein
MVGVPAITTSPQQTLQRITGTARLTLAHLEGRTRLGRLYQEGAARIRLPRTHNGAALDAVLINTSGGLTGGDRMQWSIDAGHGASAVITTQACEKIYRAASDCARVHAGIRLHAGATLAWLPQETILFEGSALSRQLEVDMAADAGLLVVEPLIIGRRAMGETVHRADFRDRWRIRLDGRLLHAEDLRLDGDVAALLNRGSTTRGAIAMATLLLVHRDAADLVEPARRLLGPDAGASAIRSSAGSRLVVRMVAPCGFELRRQLVPVIDLCNRKLSGSRQGLPKLWNL